MKLNLGCGFNKREGFVNIDKFESCNPDLVIDLELFPWPFENNVVEEVVFNHSLEHMGAEVEVFFGIVKELYRVCQPGSKIIIHVPHPRHDNFINDPTHVRIITPQLLSLFSKRMNLHWKENGFSNSPLGIYLDVDFEVRDSRQLIEQKYSLLLKNKEISEQEFAKIISERNNIISEYQITLEVIK